MSVKSALSIVASVAMLGALYVAPANALTDTNLDGANEANTTAGTSSQLKTQAIKDDTSADAMPDNPNAALPNQVSPDIPDDATVVSEDHAVTENGELKEITTGETVTDPEIVGTQDSQPDPLAKTDGESFIPVQADEVKQKVAANGGDVNVGAADAQSDSAGQSDSADTSGSDEAIDSATATNGTAKATTKGSVKLAALQNNQWGAHWGTYNGTPAFFSAKNELFVQQAKGVIDVSSWQHTIDWQAVKNAGVEGAIIRLSYGWGNGFDAQALRNINECKRLGIPFGVYIYSYAYDANTGAAEGSDVVSLLRKAGVNPGDLSYPVYYDLEKWTWTGHTPPTNPSTYDSIVNAWYGKLKSAGYNNLSVYSYTSYLDSELNSSNIHAKTRWVAQYGATMGYTAFPTNDRGWQYTSSGSVNGINGTVDLNAFGSEEFVSTLQMPWVIREEDIAVGAVANSPSHNVEFKWQSYNLSTKKWKTIAGWTQANWAGWADSAGDYWLHLEARDSQTKESIGAITIAFRYQPGSTRITGTYSGWQGGHVLLGESSNNPHARYEMKIYDVTHRKWVAGFKGQWAYWYPSSGVYWTHYEVYTSDNRLADTKTYAFGVK
ncbi:glycoside hydrolase family 25 protein [Bifidobacterium breve]|uniref:GH25 family lysozyme n=1 Tax=Bifidobacterium breve TaxID=1685 RepID=A0AAX3NKC5_BIFBR|nr:glycoside hydrolase family 25 protein [Bifidobacterium breve]AHJ18232.1 Glycosyl hydrolases family 25,lysozyme [Bifidobacterium breve JCM 7017]MDU4035505.1 GH25 family lysozyme [Bifidobacterium breve]MDU5958817.1 GH25 family lysozyme [Bifidobacterium breve]MDU8948408.1 GH25 family lysozyme [Bifidobacterium breve]WEB55971.1 GH25 family lysozyme [Bifidobacterium breve]